MSLKAENVIPTDDQTAKNETTSEKNADSPPHNLSNATISSNRPSDTFSRSPISDTSTMDTDEVIDASANVVSVPGLSNDSSQYNSQSQHDDTTTLPKAKEVIAGYRQLTPQTAADYTYMMGWTGAGVSGPVAVHGGYGERKRSYSKIDQGLDLYLPESSDEISSESYSGSPENHDPGDIGTKFLPNAIGPFNPVFDTSSPRMPVFQTPTLTPLTPQQMEMESHHNPRRLNRGRSHHGYIPGAVHPYSRAPIAGQTRERSPTPDFDTTRPHTVATTAKEDKKSWWDEFLHAWCCWPDEEVEEA
ncbi:hypothetical protein CJU89_6048 [Yarrowia sp. B02]|nr:hypothetical protein CJU89_6048 [Yarrowia sp. B02]